jgi:hypothetical protein
MLILIAWLATCKKITSAKSCKRLWCNRAFHFSSQICLRLHHSKDAYHLCPTTCTLCMACHAPVHRPQTSSRGRF